MTRALAVLGLAAAVMMACPAPPCSGAACTDAGTSTGGGSASIGGGTGGGVGITGGGSTATGGGAAVDAGSDAGTAACPPAGLAIVPASLDFGEVPAGCGEVRTLALVSTCDRPQTLRVEGRGAFQLQLDGGTLTLPAGGAVSLGVKFFAVNASLQQEALPITGDGAAWTVPVRAIASQSRSRNEGFVQAAEPKSDVLFVLSDGPGMGPAQALLAASAPAVRTNAIATGANIQFAAVLGASDAGLITSAGTPTISTVSSRFETSFATLVSPGTSGSPTVSCLARAGHTLLSSTSWRQPGANLTVLCVQDSNEEAGGAEAWRQVILAASTTRTRVSAVANFAPCASTDPVLDDAVAATSGTRQSICALDAGWPASLVFPVSNDFRLSHRADPDAGVQVRVDQVAVPDTSGTQTVWALDADQHAIVFAPLFTAEPGKTVEIEYQAACQP